MKNERSKSKKKVHLKVLLSRGLFCCVLIYIFVLLISQQISFGRVNSKEQLLDQQISAEQKKAVELAAEKEASGTDEYIERIVRDKLGYMKPSEKVFIDSSK